MDCLMLTTADERKLFTSEDNYDNVLEFCETFNAKIHHVNVTNCTLLSIPELAKAICNSNFTQNFERQEEEKIDLKTAIRQAFLAGQTVSTATLSGKFDVSKNALAGCLTKVKSELKEQGHTIIKLGVGEYRVV